MSKTINNSEWKSNPESNQWNSELNWDPNKIPKKNAIFSASDKTKVSFSEDSQSEIDQIEFTKIAPSFNFNIKVYADKPALTIKGNGITNNSRRQQCFSVTSRGVSHDKPQLKFANYASAGGFEMLYYAGPESLEEGYGGGVIGFADKSTAGSAFFTVRTGKQAPPKKNSTVGAEVSFNDSSNAGNARFTVFGTLGTDGDTFGNTVFHNKASAEHAVFTNIGGTVHGGDGGNTQFYDETTAAFGTFDNYGGNVKGANGGDVAFDGVATGGYGNFYNRAAKVPDAYGGVTSFNNNPPILKNKGATSGFASFHNFGASKNTFGGGGHTELTAKYGCPTAGNANFYNYGSILKDKSSAGHTIFSISLPTTNYPSAGNAVFWNYPSSAKDGAGGFTEFSMYDTGDYDKVPTAEKGIFINQGANINSANGGSTTFSNATTAAKATLIANGGINGGYGGRILFKDHASGGASIIELNGNGELDLSSHIGSLTIRTLKLQGGIISIKLGDDTTSLKVAEKLILKSNETQFLFCFDKKNGLEYNTPYEVLTAKNLSDYKNKQFKGNKVNGITPSFSIFKNALVVSYDRN